MRIVTYTFPIYVHCNLCKSVLSGFDGLRSSSPNLNSMFFLSKFGFDLGVCCICIYKKEYAAYPICYTLMPIHAKISVRQFPGLEILQWWHYSRRTVTQTDRSESRHHSRHLFSKTGLKFQHPSGPRHPSIRKDEEVF